MKGILGGTGLEAFFTGREITSINETRYWARQHPASVIKAREAFPVAGLTVLQH